MIRELLDQATAERDDDKRKQIILEIMTITEQNVSSVVEEAIAALNHPVGTRNLAAIELLQALGYPRNAPALPSLVVYLGDPNRLGWEEAVQILEKMDIQVVADQLIYYFLGKQDRYWAGDIEGLCLLLSEVQIPLASLCEPALSYVLSRQDLPEELDTEDHKYHLQPISR